MVENFSTTAALLMNVKSGNPYQNYSIEKIDMDCAATT
jgi:hypothetical protein